MRGRLGEATMAPNDFRSTDTVRFPASLDGLRKHFLDIARVLDTTNIDFRRHGIRGTEMNATNTAQTLIEVLLERDVPDAVQLNLILAQVKAATLDDEFGLGQGIFCKGQRQRKDGATPFMMGFVLVVGTDFIMSILYHAAMILAILYQSHLSTGMQTISHLALFLLPFNQFFKSSIYNLFNL